MKNKELVNFLIDKSYKIACAESCTGGLLASKIVAVPGASQVLDMSFVTYAIKAKIKILGVPEEVINTYGVVSEEVAREMAVGAANKASANIGIGISGNAGPTNDDRNNPVGMVCFGFHINGKTTSITKQFGEIGRDSVREKSVEFVFEYLLEELNK